MSMIRVNYDNARAQARQLEQSEQECARIVQGLQTLRTLYPRSYSGCKAITLRSNGMILSPTQTLASLGIWDGSILQGEEQYR